MLNAMQSNWQARLAADPAYQDWREQDEAAYIAAIAAEHETRRYPYGLPDQDTGWCWETPLGGISHD